MFEVLKRRVSGDGITYVVYYGMNETTYFNDMDERIEIPTH